MPLEGPELMKFESTGTSRTGAANGMAKVLVVGGGGGGGGRSGAGGGGGGVVSVESYRLLPVKPIQSPSVRRCRWFISLTREKIQKGKRTTIPVKPVRIPCSITSSLWAVAVVARLGTKAVTPAALVVVVNTVTQAAMRCNLPNPASGSHGHDSPVVKTSGTWNAGGGGGAGSAGQAGIFTLR